MLPPPLSRVPAPCTVRVHPLTAGVLLAAMLALGGLVPAQAQTSTKTAAAKPVPVAKPAWRELSSQQQRALDPLASTWDELNEPHKRKWLAIVRDYQEMSAADKEILNGRMKEWAKLSNRERAQARLNFVDAKRLPADERKAKWEAYQALSDEEKGRLAASAPSASPGAAATIRPVPAQKLVPLPAAGSDSQHTPRIQLAPPATPPLASTRAAAPAPSAPVAAEAQVPAPAAPSAPEPATASSPPIRLTDQPSSAP